MIISHRKRFVMFRPWKTASQTIALRLDSWNESPYSSFFDFNSHLHRVVHQHMTCADFFGLPESKLGYFTASFVRNPYDRIYSGFLQLQRDIRDQPNVCYPQPWIRELVLQQLFENQAQLKKAKFDFDRWFDLVTEEQIYESGRNTNFPLHPAYYWTHISNVQCVDFIGKVENFENDFQKFLRFVNIEDVETVNANVSDLKEKSTKNAFGYRYLDKMNAASIMKINKTFL